MLSSYTTMSEDLAALKNSLKALVVDSEGQDVTAIVEAMEGLTIRRPAINLSRENQLQCLQDGYRPLKFVVPDVPVTACPPYIHETNQGNVDRRAEEVCYYVWVSRALEVESGIYVDYPKYVL